MGLFWKKGKPVKVHPKLEPYQQPPAIKPLAVASPSGNSIQVVMACYNAAPWLRDTLDSIEAVMRGRYWALVLLDDCSDDRTWPILRDHISTAAKTIRYRSPAKLPTVSDTKNAVLELGRSIRNEFPVIAFMDADDTMLPGRLELLPYLRDDVVCVVGTHEVVRENGERQLIFGTDQLGTGFTFGPWATLIHARLLEDRSQPFFRTCEAHEDAMCWVRWYVEKVGIKAVPSNPVHRHYLRAGSVSMQKDITERHKRWAWFQKEKARIMEPEKLKSFCTLATIECADEVILMLQTLRMFHSEPVYVTCDAQTARLLEAERMSDVHIDAAVGTGYRSVNKPDWLIKESYHNWQAILYKMHSLRNGLRAGASMFLDSDLIHLAPMAGSWPGDLAMTTHFYPVREKVKEWEGWFGKFNTGMVFCRNEKFPDWWQQATVIDSKFLDQECTNRVRDHFCTVEMAEQYNFGFWRLGGDQFSRVDSDPEAIARVARLEVTREGIMLDRKPLQTLHLHLWKKDERYNRIQALTRWLLKNSPAHKAIVKEIERISGRFGRNPVGW